MPALARASYLLPLWRGKVMMRWCLSLSASCCRWRSDVSSDRAAKFPPPGQIQSGDRVSRDRGIFRDVQVRVIGYAAHWCGALSRRRCGGICGRAAVLLSGGRCRCQRHFLLPGFYRVLCGGRTITANKEAGFVEFWRGGRSHLPCSPVLLWPLSCCSGSSSAVSVDIPRSLRCR